MGILALRGLPTSATDRAVLNTFANDAALALERARLREQALRSHLLEEVDRFRQGLMGAVSHDLRTPLATIQVASSTLSNRAEHLRTPTRRTSSTGSSRSRATASRAWCRTCST